MSRKFKPFDQKTVNKEFASLTSEDFAGLTKAMRLFQEDAGIGYETDDFKEYGLKEIKGTGQGRAVWFFFHEDEMVVVRVFKKESQKTPKSEIETAYKRKLQYIKDHEK